MDQPAPNIRFCINNPKNLAERQDLINRGFPSRDCLGNCTRCFETHFLEIDDEQIEGETYQQIIDSTKTE